MTDDRLVQALQQGDSAALGVIYARYKVQLFGYCESLLRDRTTAEDAVHDAFLALTNRCREIRSPDALRSWLFAVARNNVMMILRRNRRLVDVDEEAPSAEEDPLDRLVRVEEGEALETSLGRLPMHYREVLLLRHREGMSYAAIAVVTGDTVEAIRARLFKARKALMRAAAAVVDERKLP